MSSGDARARLRAWFAGRGWRAFDWQERAWDAWLEGRSGVLHVATGMGKTLAAAGGPLLDALGRGDGGDGPGGGLRLLWVTPLRALAADTARALADPAGELELGWAVETRTSDTPAGVRNRQRRRLPEALVTTPESLTLLLSYPDARKRLGGLRAVVVDEWHELLGSKRGVQTELALARLLRWSPGLRVWGLTATLENIAEAARVLVGPGGDPAVLVGPERPPPRVETLLPGSTARFPWAGHLGLTLLPRVVERLEEGGTALLFTNTRSQAERWFRALLQARPGWAGDLALHHGSLSREVRSVVEARLRRGDLRCVVCTSSLDLGVDFRPVDRVFQVGSPKGVGRLVQRAGRSGHTPDGRSRIVCVPTHAFELVEFAAARAAAEDGAVEPREPVEAPLDVLVQHLVTVALGGGFEPDDLRDEVRTTWAYRALDDAAWRWCLDFVRDGGPALGAYPRYARVVPDGEGRWRVPSRAVARRHRMSVGTIVADGAVQVRFQRGRTLGAVEESFLARLRPGDRFLFAGRTLELVRVRDMVAWVRLARGGSGAVPRWMGGRMPLSSHLAERTLRLLSGGEEAGVPELAALAPILDVQRRWSRVPGTGELLVERVRTREGHHVFLYPFLGRAAHEGLAALLAWRLARAAPRSVQVSANDYGMELLSPTPFPPEDAWSDLLSPEGLLDDLLASLDATELARRRFREIARVAGLVFPGYPGRGRSARQLQASSGLMFDVLERYDPANLLLDQARREVFEGELELRRLRDGLERMSARERVETRPRRLTPLAFPVWAERIQARVSTERWTDRVERMVARLERAADRDRGAA